MAPFKDDQVLLISPGSQTTLAQIGLPESFTPAKLRMPTRMFPAETEGEWEAARFREVRLKKKVPAPPGTSVDVEMADGDGTATANEVEVEEILYEEDPTNVEGAVYPLKDGRIVHWPAFFALLSHVYTTLSPTLHTPIILLGQASWTSNDHETITQFIFEKFKSPAFCLMDSALAACYAYGVPSAVIVDVGYEKADITAVVDFIVYHSGRGIAVDGLGGEALTQNLVKLLEPKGLHRAQCEQLKRSNICEVLPKGTSLPEPSEVDTTVTTGVQLNGSEAGAPVVLDTATGVTTTVTHDDDAEDGPTVEADGVLDVASIVASGKTSEFLAKKEKEKATRGKKGQDQDAKPVRLPNGKRYKNSFWYEEAAAPVAEEEVRNGDAENKGDGDAQAASTAAAQERQKQREARRAERRAASGLPSEGGMQRREIEVTTERFQAASPEYLDALTDAVHRCVSSVAEVSRRNELWETMIICGNGSKIRGFKEAVMATLTGKYLISPSSATIFTSELPSNITTPIGTGTNTPQGLPPGNQHQFGGGASQVNPLLLQATTGLHPGGGPPNTPQHHNPQYQQQSQQHLLQQQQQTPLTPQQQILQQQAPILHSGHSQSPTTLKLAKMPEYFPEWKEVGFDEAAFLGAQIAAKVVFIIDQGNNKGFLTRSDYNELGPAGIHDYSL